MRGDCHAAQCHPVIKPIGDADCLHVATCFLRGPRIADGCAVDVTSADRIGMPFEETASATVFAGSILATVANSVYRRAEVIRAWLPVI
jgi:hypothetical protein